MEARKLNTSGRINILFICTANKIRSKTAEVHFQAKYPELIIRSAGTNKYAVKQSGGVLISEALLESAEEIVCMEQEHADYVQAFSSSYSAKIQVLNIPDDYKYMGADLIKELESKYDPLAKRSQGRPEHLKERRLIDAASQTHARAYKDAQGKKVLEGYAAVFGERSKLLFESGKVFYEVLERTAFNQVLKAADLDVLLTYNHDMNKLMARLHKKRGVNSLTLAVDARGLKFRAVLSNTSVANDAFALVASGDVHGCSFIFTVDDAGQRWSKTEEGVPLRYISSISGLYDVSVVVNPAYEGTDVAAAERSFKAQQNSKFAATPSPDYFQSFYEEWRLLANKI